MKAVILSCSEGTRLRPVTCSIPQSMLPVMGRPVAEHMVKSLRRHKIENIVITADYLADTIKKHFSSLDQFHIEYSSIQNIGNFLQDDDILLISDSIITDIDFSEFLAVFKSNNCTTVVSKHDAPACEYGCIHTNADNIVTSYTRCPDYTLTTGSTFMGIMAVPKGVCIHDCKDISSFMEKLTEKGTKILSYTPKGYISTITDFESYQKCNRDFMDKKIQLPFPCDEKAPGVWIDESATVMQGSIIVPPVYIGKGTIVSKGARIGAYTQIGCDVTVDCLTDIKRSIIMSGCHIDEGSSLRGCILSDNCRFGFESVAYEGSVIASGTTVGRHCTVRNGVHIWPGKYISDESIVQENIIWGETSSRSLFSDGCAYGIVNREITPEFAATLARSSPAVLGRKIAVSSEGGGAGAMIKNALISGIQSAGAVVYDLGEQPLPITRSAVRFYGLDGALAFCSHRKDGCLYGCIDIINSTGANIETAALEKICQDASAGDAKRADAKKIHEGEFLFEYKLYYLKQLINSTSKLPLGKKLLISCPDTWAKELLTSAAHDLECEFVFTDTYDREQFLKEITCTKYDFGAICDYKCQSITLITGSGQILSEFDYTALTALITMKSFPHASIYVPRSSPENIAILAKKYNAKIHYTLISPPNLMNELSKSDRKLFLHQFIYRFDAVGAIILLLDFLHNRNTTIEMLMSEIPASYTTSGEVSCRSDEQRALLRKLCKRHNVQSDEVNDSIRVNFENGWVIVIPKPSDSVINVISHGYTKEYAGEIADIFTDELSEK